ncbi:MAG: winged helix-turn-helix domain-containing protein [Bacillota bacterium]
MGSVEPRIKLWLETQGEVVFGTGRLELLTAIDSLGSLNKAANKLDMSYRAAWGKIKASEERLGIDLVESTVGGSTGGGTELTAQAQEIIRHYREYERLVKEEIDQIYQEKMAELFDLVE